MMATPIPRINRRRTNQVRNPDGVRVVIAEYDKLAKLLEAQSHQRLRDIETASSVATSISTMARTRPCNGVANDRHTEVDDAPVVRFLPQKMLIDAINMRASDLPFEPYEYNYRVRFRIDGELREITSAAHRDQRQTGIAYKSHLPPGHLREASAARRPDEAQDSVMTESSIFGVSTLPTLIGERSSSVSSTRQREARHRCAGLRE